MIDFLPFTFVYLPGEKMPADSLSRLTKTINEVTPVNDPKSGWSLEATSDQLYHLQCQDKYIKALVCYLRYRRLPDHPVLYSYVNELKDLAVFRQGIVGIKREDRFLALAPLHIRSTLLTLAHDDPMSGHMGSNKTRTRLQDCWYWLGMKQDVEKYCQSCPKCQSANPAHNRKPAPLEPMPSVTRFNERVHIDLLGPMPATNENQGVYLLVMVDAFSSWMECAAIPNKKAETVIKAFLDTWVSQHSYCKQLHSDLGSEFKNLLFKDLSGKLGFQHSFSSVAHPQSNGQVERANRTIIGYIRKFITDNRGWGALLPALRFALNSAPHATKRYTPFHLVYGRRPTMAHMLHNPVRSYSEEETAQKLAFLNRITQEVCK
jgi:transposase InsO family protein